MHRSGNIRKGACSENGEKFNVYWSSVRKIWMGRLGLDYYFRSILKFYMEWGETTLYSSLKEKNYFAFKFYNLFMYSKIFEYPILGRPCILAWELLM